MHEVKTQINRILMHSVSFSPSDSQSVVKNNESTQCM